jgi:hypothetical protein
MSLFILNNFDLVAKDNGFVEDGPPDAKRLLCDGVKSRPGRNPRT